MAPRINRLERITNLVLALLETSRPLSLREIGTVVAGYPPEHGALRQAFERDKRTLRDGGIPVATERLDGEEQVGYRILPEEYYLANLELTEDESEALGFALAMVHLEGNRSGDLASKLGAPPASEVTPFVVLPSLPALGPLQLAIREHRRTSFDYHGRPRTVAGYGLVFREGSWYLVGYETGADALRTFRVDRIEGEPMLGEKGEYELPENFDVAAQLRLSPLLLADSAEAVEVILEVDAPIARGVLSTLGDGAVVTARHEDGSVECSVRVGDDAAFLSYVLGLGDAAVVRSPASFRDKVIDALLAASGGSGAARR